MDAWKKFAIFNLTWLCLSLSAQETLPPYHWANRYIDYLKVRGYFPELSVSNRPYQRQEIARQLLQIDWDVLENRPIDQHLVRTLFQEFAGEIKVEGGRNQGKWDRLIKEVLQRLQIELLPETMGPDFKAGTFGEGILNYSDETATSTGSFNFHTQAGVFWKNRFMLYNQMKIFNRADADYIGKEFRNLHAFTEQGYVSLDLDWVQAKVGRDFMQIGPGRSGQLLISDNSRPFDLYHITIGRNILQFSFWGFLLNQRRVPPLSPDSALGGQAANRYLNGHRLSLNLHNKFFLGVSEVVLYGGTTQGWNLGFMNPFLVYWGQVVNNPGLDGNVFYNLDWDLYPLPDVEIYGEFLIDDFQVDKKEPGDLEPNELGFLGGVQWANFLGMAGSLLNFEYVQIRNRTYNAPVHDWEKYLHRNKVIGYFLGNNMERFGLSLSRWMNPDVQLKLFGYLTRKGEGSVKGEFNTDFLNYTVEEGYNEPFPFGIIERHRQWGISVFFRPNRWANLTADLVINHFDNFQHVSGSERSELMVRVSMWLQWQKFWQIGKL